MSQKKLFHSVQLAGYSSVVGQPIMLLNESGAVVAQVAIYGVVDGIDYKALVAEVADQLKPNTLPNGYCKDCGHPSTNCVC